VDNHNEAARHLLERRAGEAGLVKHPTRASSLVLIGFDLAALVVTAVGLQWTLVRGAAFIGLLFTLLALRGHYRTRMSRNVGEDASMIVAAIAGTILAVAVVVTAGRMIEPRLSTLVGAAGGGFVVLMASRWAGFALLVRLRRRGHLRSRAVVVGTGVVAREIGAEFGHRIGYGVDIAGYVARQGLEAESRLPGPVIGNLADLARLVELTRADRVIVTLAAGDNDQVVEALRTLPAPDVSIFVIPQLFELGVGSDSLTPDRTRGFALVRLGRSAHPVIGIRFKRLFDVAASGIALLVLSPLLVAAAIAVRLSSPGPVLFRQERVGRFGERFELLKFRSMRVNNDSATAWTPAESDAQVTTVGRFLRWSSIDELPQLLNILRGDMSVVGPRPERPAFVDDFSLTVPGYVHRHRLPVGLTGAAQIRGLRGDTPMEERARVDNLYIDQWSFSGDLMIIAKTVWAIVRQGAYAEAEIDLTQALAKDAEGEQQVIDLVAIEAASEKSPN
jgi:exopolysaccharide biosynthesis polyprenyl glycosylphosphotransferase